MCKILTLIDLKKYTNHERLISLTGGGELKKNTSKDCFTLNSATAAYSEVCIKTCDMYNCKKILFYSNVRWLKLIKYL